MSDVQNLEKAARAEKWDYVDKTLPKAVRKPEVISAATLIWISDSNVQLRDLAGSVLEQAKLSEAQLKQVKPVLLEVISKDRTNYAGFRAACALAAHGYKGEEVLGVLRSFEKDKDVGAIAKKYLKS